MQGFREGRTLTDLIIEARDSDNDWPGLPVGHVWIADWPLVHEAIENGTVAIVERVRKVDPERVAEFLVLTN